MSRGWESWLSPIPGNLHKSSQRFRCPCAVSRCAEVFIAKTKELNGPCMLVSCVFFFFSEHVAECEPFMSFYTLHTLCVTSVFLYFLLCKTGCPQIVLFQVAAYAHWWLKHSATTARILQYEHVYKKKFQFSLLLFIFHSYISLPLIRKVLTKACRHFRI